jgi:outer membrane lipoprotein-sorting protein
MRTIAGSCCVLAVLVSAVPARAPEDAQLREVVAKAIKAHGGADNLKKFKASVTTSKGKFYGLGDAVEYTGETSLQMPDRSRNMVEGKVGDNEFKFVQVINGDKGWTKLNDNTEEMSKEALAEAREQMNLARITHLTVLTDKDYKLSSLGDAKVGDRPAVAIRVEHTGFRDVSLFFDKENHLLLKSEVRGKDLMKGGEEYTAETLYGDYKKFEGLMAAQKITIKRDGKLYVEGESTEIKFSEKLDDSVFEKP